MKLWKTAGSFLVLLSLLVAGHASAQSQTIERMDGIKEGYGVAGVWEGTWKYGYVDTTGAWKIKPTYDAAKSFHDGFAVIGVKTSPTTMKYGYLKKDGSYLVQPKYDDAADFQGHYAIVGSQKASTYLFGVIDRNGKEILPIHYDSVHIEVALDGAGALQQSIHLVRDGEKSLYLPSLNKLYDGGYNGNYIFVEDYIISHDNDKLGLIFPKNGKEIPPIFDNRTYLVQEKIYDEYGVRFTMKNIGVIVEQDGKFGSFDFQGNPILDIKYDSIRTTDSGIWMAKKEGKVEIFKKDGSLLIKERYDEVSAYNWRHLYYVTLDGKRGILKLDGTYLVKPIYDDVYNFSAEGYATVVLNGKKGLIDISGKTVLEPKYDYIDLHYRINGAADPTEVIKAHGGGKDYFFQKDFSPYQSAGSGSLGDFDTIGSFENGIARVEKDGKIGYVREDFSYIVKPVYDSAYQAILNGKEMDYFTIRQGDAWGAVSMNGTVFKPIFDNPPEVSEDIAIGIIGGEYRFVTKNNVFLNSEAYKIAWPFNEGKALVAQEYGHYYFIDTKGKKASKVYTNATSYSEGIAYAREGNYGFYIDHKEKTVLGEGMKMTMGFPFSNGVAPVNVYVPEKQQHLYGVMKRDGSWLVKPQFETIKDYGGNQYGYVLNDKEAEITPDGRIMWK